MIPRLKSLNWLHVAFITFFHVLAIAALLFTRPRPIDVALLVVMYLITGFGITVGFHRLIAHRGFSCPAWLRNVFAFIGTASLQGGPISWCANHRRHHQVSDKPQDVHSPVKSFFWAHLGWILNARVERFEPLVKDLRKERFLQWLDRPVWSITPAFTLALLCYLVADVQGMLWGTFLRTVLVWHATWCVNSFCHAFGSRMYATPDRSRNLWWVGLVALGEGWHNNHHARPRCAFHGHAWWQLDFSSILIKSLALVGLARNVVPIPDKHEHEEACEVA